MINLRLDRALSRTVQSPVIWTFLVTALRSGGFFLVLPVILRTVPSDELGLWYVFLGIAQFAGIAELGFSSTISRFTSYFLGGAREIPALGLVRDEVSGQQPNLEGLAGLVRTARWLYFRISGLMFILMIAGGGGWLYWKYPSYATRTPFALAYFFFVVGTVTNMLGYFWPGVLFGLNKVRSYQQAFLLGLLLNYAVCLVGLWIGGKLFALAGGQFVLGLYTRWKGKRTVLQTVDLMDRTPHEVPWRILWPTTWRTGLVGLASYLSLPVTTLLCAQVLDLHTTASYGLSLQLALMLHGLSAAWMTVIWPKVNAMRSRGELAEVTRLVKTRMALSVMTFALGAIVACIVGPLTLKLLRSKTEFLPEPQLALLMLTVGVDFIMGCHSAVIQTGNQTLHLRPFIVTGVLTPVMGLMLGKFFGVTGVIIAPLASQALFNAWVTPYLCWKDLNRSPS